MQKIQIGTFYLYYFSQTFEISISQKQHTVRYTDVGVKLYICIWPAAIEEKMIKKPRRCVIPTIFVNNSLNKNDIGIDTNTEEKVKFSINIIASHNYK